MPGVVVRPKKHRLAAAGCSLQPGSHLGSLPGCDSRIVHTGGKQHCRIRGFGLDVLICIHGKQSLESVGFFHRTKFGDIGGTAGHQLGTQRVGVSNPDQGGTEQLRTLGDSAANGDSSGAGSLTRKMRRRGELVFDQILGAGQKVINGVLLGELLPTYVPVCRRGANLHHTRRRRARPRTLTHRHARATASKSRQKMVPC